MAARIKASDLPASMRKKLPKAQRQQRPKAESPLRGLIKPSLVITLPFPPTVNTYWRMVNGKMLISKRGRQYRQRVIECCLGQGHVTGRLRMTIYVYAPDARRRDLDNLLKGILDSCQAAGLYRDDSQVDELRVVRMMQEPPGLVRVTLETIGGGS